MEDREIEEAKKEPADRDDYLEVKSRNRVVKSLDGPGWEWFLGLLQDRIAALLEKATSEASIPQEREQNLYRYWEARHAVRQYIDELSVTNEYLRTHKIGE